jgi:hypothetical protein
VFLSMNFFTPKFMKTRWYPIFFARYFGNKLSTYC